MAYPRKKENWCVWSESQPEKFGTNQKKSHKDEHFKQIVLTSEPVLNLRITTCKAQVLLTQAQKYQKDMPNRLLDPGL